MNFVSRILKDKKKREILMDEEEQEQFFARLKEKQASKSHNEEGQRKIWRRKNINNFDKDGISLQELRESIRQFFSDNRLTIEKTFLAFILLALISVLLWMSSFLASTLGDANIQRKSQFLDSSVAKPLSEGGNEYKLIQLSNNLEVLIIRKESSEMSSVALDIHVGSWQEPQQVPGLAHLMEHMSFIASAKFSSEGYLDSLVSSSGGTTNSQS